MNRRQNAAHDGHGDGNVLQINPTRFREPTGRSKSRYITLTKRGSIFFSKGLVKTHNLWDQNFVELGYDDEVRMIAMRFSATPSFGANKITKTGSGSMRITRKKFFDRFKLPMEEIIGKYFADEAYAPGWGKVIAFSLDNRA